MSKRKWVVFSCTLIAFLLYGATQTVFTADTTEDTYIASCERVDEEIEDTVASIMEIFQEEDYGRLTDRVNELVTSQEMVEEEVHALELAFCINDSLAEIFMQAEMDGYHSLLLVVRQMNKEKDIQFEEITYNLFKRHGYVEVEGVLENEKEHITIEHYFGIHPMNGYSLREQRLTEEKLQKLEEESSSLLLTISSGISSMTFKVLQNPIEKLMGSIDSFFIEKDEQEQEIFEIHSGVNASYFNMDYSIITYTENRWHPVRMVEYYPSKKTYHTLIRAEQVYQELPNYPYPKEEIERGDWNGVIAYYENHQDEMYIYDEELYDYILNNVLHESKNFEELIDKVKNNHGLE